MNGLQAQVVWHSLSPSQLNLPISMGQPRPDQLQGTPGERLCEGCGRICYDSLKEGKGRSSDKYHEHIKKVQHYSTVEHFNITVEFDNFRAYRYILTLLNRKGVWVDQTDETTFRITYNPRVILDWHKHRMGWFRRTEEGRTCETRIYRILKHEMNLAVPRIVPHVNSNDLPQFTGIRWKRVNPENEHEIWMSAYMRGSRGFSHEQVRHRNPVSQRSTRYCDESESNWIIHPLYERYMKETGDTSFVYADLYDGSTLLKSLSYHNIIRNCQIFYDGVVNKLQTYLLGKGKDKLTARKQARGAGRGFLGNALATELIMSASVWDWKHMFDMRMTDAADAEIRLVYNSLYEDLMKSNLKDCFMTDIIPSSDGLGFVLKELYHGDHDRE
jgi:thymidylate synthase ThyX